MIQNIRLLKAVVIILGLIIFIGLSSLILIIGQRLGDTASPDTGVRSNIELEDLQLPVGAKILDFDLDDNRVAVRILLPEGTERLDIFDLSVGKQIGTINISP